MSKKKMLEAQRLIKAKDYDAARKILRTVDHPKAREWEAQLDKIAPVTTKGTGPNRLLLVLAVLALVTIAILVVVVLLGTPDNPQPAPQVAEQPSLEATTAPDDAEATVTVDDSATNLPPSLGERPEGLPAAFPFPDGGFTPVFDLSDGSDISLSVTSPLSLSELDAFYREILPSAGYEFLDFSANDSTILSFVGNGTRGNVRVTDDGPGGIARITVEMEPTTATSLEELEPGNNQSVAGDLRFDQPEEAAAAFMTALVSGDSVTVLALVCDANKVNFDEEQYRGFIGGPDIPGGEVDVSPLQYEVVEQDGDMAQVAITGEMIVRITAADVDSEVPVPVEEPIIMELQRVDGWQICTT